MPIPSLILLMAAFLTQEEAASKPSCQADTMRVEGLSLQGVLTPGDELAVYPLACRTPERGDLLIFKLRADNRRYVKILWGSPGDSLAIVDERQITIDGIPLVRPSGRPVRVSRLSSMVVTPLVGVLEGYFVLGVPGSTDSMQVGLIKQRFVIGSVPRHTLKGHTLKQQDKNFNRNRQETNG